MRRFFSQLLDLVLPPSPDVVLARKLSPKRLEELSAPRELSSGVFALFPYSDAGIRALIRAVKYHGERQALTLPAAMLGEFALELISEKRLLSGWDMPLLIPMPAARERERERGYNQTKRVIEALLPTVGDAADLSEEILFREHRPSQVSVDRSKRPQNIRRAFYIKNPEAVRGRVCILIDDVVESGSTFADAKRALMEGGAQEVIGIALAH